MWCDFAYKAYVGYTSCEKLYSKKFIKSVAFSDEFVNFALTMA